MCDAPCVLHAAGVDRRARAELDVGKADFNRYAESGQVMINRAMHLGEQEGLFFACAGDSPSCGPCLWLVLAGPVTALPSMRCMCHPTQPPHFHVCSPDCLLAPSRSLLP